MTASKTPTPLPDVDVSVYGVDRHTIWKSSVQGWTVNFQDRPVFSNQHRTWEEAFAWLEDQLKEKEA